MVLSDFPNGALNSSNAKNLLHSEESVGEGVVTLGKQAPVRALQLLQELLYKCLLND